MLANGGTISVSVVEVFIVGCLSVELVNGLKLLNVVRLTILFFDIVG